MLILAFALFMIVTTVALVRTISSDGYGKRPIPPSRHDDFPPHRLR